MKLSEVIAQEKLNGTPKPVALSQIRDLIEDSGHEWTDVKQQLFDKVWSETRKDKPVLKVQVDPNDPLLELEGVFNRLTEATSLSQATHFYLQLWTYYNHLHFNNQLLRPTFEFLKNTKAFRVRAYYKGGPNVNQFSFSRKLFNTDFKNFCNTFVHEMCHQAVHLIDGRKGYIKESGRRDIHGDSWKAWMRHCKLDPERCDKTDNLEYLNETDKQKVIQKKEEREFQEQNKVPITNPKPNQLAKYYSDIEREWIRGILVCPENAKANRWVLAYQLHSASYRLVPTRLLFKLEHSETGDLNTFTWTDYVATLRNNYQGNILNKKQDSFIKKVATNKEKGIPGFTVHALPQSKRMLYVIIAYVLTKTQAKEGHGSYSIGEIKLYSEEQIIQALTWMEEIDNRKHVFFDNELDRLKLTPPNRGVKPGKYSLEDFQIQLVKYYGERV